LVPMLEANERNGMMNSERGLEIGFTLRFESRERSQSGLKEA